MVSDLREALGDMRATALVSWPDGARQEWVWAGAADADSCTRVGALPLAVPSVAGDVVIDLTLEAEGRLATNRYTAVIVAA